MHILFHKVLQGIYTIHTYLHFVLKTPGFSPSIAKAEEISILTSSVIVFLKHAYTMYYLLILQNNKSMLMIVNNLIAYVTIFVRPKYSQMLKCMWYSGMSK